MRKADPELQNRRRSEIITAAEACFLKKGFHQSSMQDIASAAGLSMGLLYRYFTNKEAIVEAAAAQDQDAVLTRIEQLRETGDVVTAWAKLIDDMADAASDPNYAALANEIIAEAHRSPKVLHMLHSNDAALERAIQQKLSAQRRNGAIKGASVTETTAQALMLLLDGLTMRRMLHPDHARIIGPTTLARLVSVLVDSQVSQSGSDTHL